MTTVSTPSSDDRGNTRLLLVLWGILLIVAGLFFAARPSTSAVVWIEIMAVVWLIGGIFDAFHSITSRGHYWGWRLAGAIICILAGVYIIVNPLLGSFFVIQTAFILLAIAAIVYGCINLFIAFRVHGGSRWARIILGLIQVVIGIWLLLNPLVGMLSVIVIFGVLLVIGGLVVLFMAFQ